MRATVRVLAPFAVLVLLAPVAHAGTVSGLAITGGPTHRLSEGSVEVTGTASFAGDPSEPATVAFTDGTADGQFWREATPPYQDLIEGSIKETATNLVFTWKVVDLPDPPAFLPGVAAYYWEFTLLPPGATEPVPFQLSVSLDPRGRAQGSLASNCTATQNVISCEEVPGSMVAASLDPLENTVTAVVRKSDLRKPPSTVSLARPGTLLRETELFQGIAAFTSFVVLVSALTEDTADMARPYVLGKHVELAIAEPGIPDEDARLLFGDLVALPDGSGAWRSRLSLDGLVPGEYDVLAQACTGGVCGDIARTRLVLTE